MVILGPGVALSKAQKIRGLTVDNQGQVSTIISDPKLMLKKLTEDFMEFSGHLARESMQMLLSDYPEIAKEISK